MSRYFLFARPSFWSGMARVVDLGGTLNEYNYSISPRKADYYAIRSDWNVVGDDIREAVNKYDDELTENAQET
jgi:hypothetical protein